jgi:predicted DNA-binding protein (UPF0251 family)
MTPKSMIRKSTNVFVSFGVAAVPGDVTIYVTKTEALRLVDVHRLPADDSYHPVGCVSFHSGVALITFHT